MRVNVLSRIFVCKVKNFSFWQVVWWNFTLLMTVSIYFTTSLFLHLMCFMNYIKLCLNNLDMSEWNNLDMSEWSGGESFGVQKGKKLDNILIWCSSLDRKTEMNSFIIVVLETAMCFFANRSFILTDYKLECAYLQIKTNNTRLLV